MHTFAGLLLTLIAAAFLVALAKGQGRTWLRSKFLGTPGDYVGGGDF